MLILESRYAGDRQHRTRRYECPSCKTRYCSYEQLFRSYEPIHCKPNS